MTGTSIAGIQFWLKLRVGRGSGSSPVFPAHKQRAPLFRGLATVSVAVSIRLRPAALVAPRLQPPTVASGTA